MTAQEPRDTKPKINFKGGGQECPPHTRLDYFNILIH